MPTDDEHDLARHDRGIDPVAWEVDAVASDEDGLSAPFVALADALFAVAPERGVAGVIERVVEAACAIVPGADVVSVVMRGSDERFSTVAHNHPSAERADRMQDELDEGPSHTAALASGLGVAQSAELSTEVQWPRFGAGAVAELGLHAVLSTGMFPGGDPPRFGALNFYSWTPGGLDAADRDHALVLAAHAATAVSAARARTASDLREAQLTEALQSRDAIGQAKGILMERRGYTADEAFAVLRRTSQDLNVKLREVASTLVTRRTEL